MKLKPAKRLLAFSIILNVVLVLACSFLLYKAGYLSALVNRGKGQSEANPQFEMRESLFELLPQTDTNVVFVGDSITERCEWSELLPNYNVKNRGIGSDTTTGVLSRINEVVALKPDKIFLMIGINDLSIGNDIEEIAKNYESILSTIKSTAPATKVYIQSVLPTRSESIKGQSIVDLNALLSPLAEKYGYTYVDIYSQLVDTDGQLKAEYTADGVHLKGNAYQIWIDNLKQYLK